FCLGGLFVPLTTLFLSGLPTARQTQAVELGGMLRVLGGSVASPLFGIFWERRTAFHQSRLIESLSLHDSWSMVLVDRLYDAGLYGQLASAKLASIANQHAAVLGLEDTFRVSAWLFLGLAGLVWFAYPVGPKTPANLKEDQHQTELEDLMEEP
ncbi:MAG: MFS transporter, partial [Methylovulum sp.]|nr:MFS transporter [Methylovulum sp.]